MITIVVFGDAGINIMRGININLAIKYVGRWVGSVNGTDKRFGKVFYFCFAFAEPEACIRENTAWLR